MKVAFCLCLSTVAFAAVATKVDPFAAQVIITYTPPSSADCTIDVRELGAATVVHDVDSTLFAGSNLDSRSTSVNSGTLRKIVVGKIGAADKGLDNVWYSRALQAWTMHSYSLCSGTITGTFMTTNVPLGQTHAMVLPVDPAVPGAYAWPDFVDRTTPVIDPQNGMWLKLIEPDLDFAKLESTGDENWFNNCSGQQVANATGTWGWHCAVAGTFYWISPDGSIVNRLAKTVPNFVQGVDFVSVGWNPGGGCVRTFWDSVSGNTAYCQVSNNALPAGTYVLKMVYSGDNRDMGAVSGSVTTCGSAPCWTVTLLNSLASLEAQVELFSPNWAPAKFHAGATKLFGTMGSRHALVFDIRRDDHQDDQAFAAILDTDLGTVVAAKPSWAYWPARWAAFHGPFNSNDTLYVATPETAMRGSLTAPGNGVAGNGPYISTVVGSLPTSASACPSRPALSPISVSDWPSGSNCSVITVAGEPGDPSPGFYSDGIDFTKSPGTIAVSGSNVTGTGTAWGIFMDQGIITTTTNHCRFTYVDATHGTISSCTGTLVNGNYTLYTEEIYTGQTGDSLWSYLQDADVRDLYCILPSSLAGASFCSRGSGVSYYSGSQAAGEVVRLLIKSGNTWTIERGYRGSESSHTPLSNAGASAVLIAQTPSCSYGTVEYCDETRTVWKTTDIYGANLTGNTVVVDPGDILGCCHGTHQGLHVDLSQVSPAMADDATPAYYFSRYSIYAPAFTDSGQLLAQNPAFHAFVGFGKSNGVDTHPSHGQFSAVANEYRWISDDRVWMGDRTSSINATSVAGDLWKFAAGTMARFRPRVSDTLAACGSFPLKNISAAGSSIGTTSGDNYKYCAANAADECRSGSTAGDVFANCPLITTPNCIVTDTGNQPLETQDICIGDQGAYTLANVQLAANMGDPVGAQGRRVSAIGWYRLVYEFGNNKVTPDGGLMFNFIRNRGAVNARVVMAKLPPFPAQDSINRGDFIPLKVVVPAISPAANNVIVKFGYDPSYLCTSRNDACVANAATIPTSSTPFAYISESPTGLACAATCTILVPAIADRAVYYQIIWRNVSNVTLKTYSNVIKSL